MDAVMHHPDGLFMTGVLSWAGVLADNGSQLNFSLRITIGKRELPQKKSYIPFFLRDSPDQMTGPYTNLTCWP